MQQDPENKPEVNSKQGLEWLSEYGDALYAYAFHRVGSVDLAEDLVQETLLGAVSNAESYSGTSTRKTWLIGILRHKLADHFRQVSKLRSADESDPGDAAIEQAKMHERVAQQSWSNPKTPIEYAELRAAIEECITELPDLVRQSLEFRYYDAMETEEICEVQKISSNNLAARMYRARMFLRDCLNRKWQ